MMESDLGLLVTAYARCDLVQTSPYTYALDCGWDDDAPVYYRFDNRLLMGTEWLHTDNFARTWTPPFAL